MINNMKKNSLYTLVLLFGFSLLGVSCSKDNDELPDKPDTPITNPDEPKTPTYPTFDNPNWIVNGTSSFEYTMTVSMVLPDSLRNDEQSTDKLAIFSGDDCRGVANRISVSNDGHVWLVMVYGNTDTNVLSIKYYSSKTKYMYQSATTKTFVADGMIGTIDNPETVGMNIVTKK